MKDVLINQAFFLEFYKQVEDAEAERAFSVFKFNYELKNQSNRTSQS